MNHPGGTARTDEGFVWLTGGGQMGNLVWQLDWSGTALGPIEGWSPTLRTSINLVLASPVPIVTLWGREGIMIYNDAYAQFAGARHPQLLGAPVLEGWPEVADFNRRVMDVCLGGGTLSFRDEHLVLGRHGVPEDVWLDLNYSPVRDDTATPIGVIAVVVETTERVRAERQIRALNQILEQQVHRLAELGKASESANRAKDEFLAMLGHELRNPLAPILTALQLMKLRGTTAVEHERSVIERQVNHMVALVDDLLDVSRITRGKVELHRARVDVARFVAKAIEIASPLLEQQRHSLQVEVPSSGLTVDGDEGRLAQVVSNLLTNAAKYTEAGGLIAITAHADKGEAVLRVRDNGTGIDPEMLPNIFDLFVQEPQAIDRSRGGLGLGLAIVRNLVALHGGSVRASSAGKGLGSEFEIRLPLLSAFPETVSRAVDPPARKASHRQARVLIVDDNVEYATLLAETLTELGYRTRHVHDALSALSIDDEFVPDVALVDIGLPVMDGYELAKRLRATPHLAAVRLIAITGYGQEEDRARSHEAGFLTHLVKPIDIDTLQAAIEATMLTTARRPD
jgi:PAS domain S-box-containing protein